MQQLIFWAYLLEILISYFYGILLAQIVMIVEYNAAFMPVVYYYDTLSQESSMSRQRLSSSTYRSGNLHRYIC